MSGEKVYATASFLQFRDARPSNWQHAPNILDRSEPKTPGNRRRVLPNWQRMTRLDVWAQAVSENSKAR